MTTPRPLRFETLSVHAGYSPDPTTKSAAVPLYQTVAYAFDSAKHGADLFDLKAGCGGSKGFSSLGLRASIDEDLQRMAAF
jgi:O-acetylhomoserine/O-acetylserine sulfhydrylase-like pyridoxal-dependent enzyme